GLKDAMALVIIPSISSNLVVMQRSGHLPETLRRFWPMLLATLPGLVLGLWVLSAIDGVLAGGVLGLLLLLWCVFTLVNPSVRLPTYLERPLGPVSGFLTGLLNGVTGSQVMPTAPYLMMLGLQRDQFIVTINCSFTMSSLVMAVGLNRLGLFSVDALILSVIGSAFIFFGLNIGERIRHRLSPDRFRIAVLVMLIAMGFSLLGRAV
ncbi:MAG: sulfite exporter TauE/SafE family protein, partial [Paracoccaceae bacterium]